MTLAHQTSGQIILLGVVVCLIGVAGQWRRRLLQGKRDHP